MICGWPMTGSPHFAKPTPGFPRQCNAARPPPCIPGVASLAQGQRPQCMVAMLAPVDVAALRQVAALRPTARLHLAPREARLHDPHLRAAFAIWGLESASPHLRPCQRCGLCTASWFEACEPALAQGLPPVAICTACDSTRTTWFAPAARRKAPLGMPPEQPTSSYTRGSSPRRPRASGSRQWLLRMGRSAGSRPPKPQATDEATSPSASLGEVLPWRTPPTGAAARAGRLGPRPPRPPRPLSDPRRHSTHTPKLGPG